MAWWTASTTNAGGAAKAAGASGATATAGGGFDWLGAGLNILGSVAPAILMNEAANDQADAYNASSAQNAALQRDIYNDQRGLAMPGYLQGGAARNILANQFGISPQDYLAASKGGYGYGGNVATDGSTIAPNYGAGQPVEGHSGGNGQGAMIGSALGAAAGSFLPVVGPWVGSALGGLAGGLIGGSGGDNWTTLATQAPAGFDYDAYWNNNPDLAADPNGWNKPDVQALFNGNKDAYLYWHYNKFGKGEGRELAKLGGGDKSNQPVGGVVPVDGAATGAATGTNNPLGDPLQMFWDSPHGQLATDQFLSVDNPAVKGAFATGGQAMSGAQTKALQDRGKATAGNFFGAYNSDLKDMAGMNSSSTALMSSAGQNYGSSMGNILNNQASVAANKSATQNANWMNAGTNLLAGGYDYGKSQGWF